MWHSISLVSVIFAVTIFRMVLLAQSLRTSPRRSRTLVISLPTICRMPKLTLIPTRRTRTHSDGVFTEVLAGVGVLQFVVMFLTWLVYRR